MYTDKVYYLIRLSDVIPSLAFYVEKQDTSPFLRSCRRLANRQTNADTRWQGIQRNCSGTPRRQTARERRGRGEQQRKTDT